MGTVTDRGKRVVVGDDTGVVLLDPACLLVPPEDGLIIEWVDGDAGMLTFSCVIETSLR